MNSQECKTIRYHKNNRKSFTKEGRSSVTSHNLDYPDPAHFLQPRSCPSPSPSLVSVISPLVSVFPLIWVPVSVHLIHSPSLLPQGVVLRADQSFDTARSRGQPRCPSSPSCSSTTFPSSWPRPGPSTAFPSSIASQAAAVYSSLPHWLPPLLKAQLQLLQGSHMHPPTEVPGKLGLSQKPHGHHPWAVTPLSGVLAPLGPAPTLLPPLRAPLPQGSPQPQKAHSHGASPVLLLSSLQPLSSCRRKIRRY